MDVATIVAKIERFTKLGALKIHQKDLQKALEAYRRAYENVLLLDHDDYMKRACAFNLGAINISCGNYNNGLTYLKEAEQPDSHQDGKSNGDLYFNFGLAYEGLQNVAEMIPYYNRALKEYQTEKDNMKMEAEVLSRLGRACVQSGHFNEAEAYTRQLIQIYDKLYDFQKHLQTLVEQASLLIRLEKIEEAEKIADYCWMKFQDEEMGNKSIHLLIELSIVFIQLCIYDRAEQCCHYALQIIKIQGGDVKQVAVLYQNLGAIYNFQEKYQNAIEYHRVAAIKFAESNNRKSQGHCFINLGYAYSQLNDIKQAGENYLHSLQAARDCGDRKSEWQSLEALGSVSSLQGDTKHSHDYYKSALIILAKSQDAENVVAQDRILEKLTKASNVRADKHDESDPKVVTKQDENMEIKGGLDKIRQENNERLPSPSKTQKELLKKEISKDGSVIAVRKNGQVKYLRVRRSGTMHKFNKVALGLDTSTSPILSQSPTKQTSLNMVSEDDEDDIFSASSISFTNANEDKWRSAEISEDIPVNENSQRQRLLDEEDDSDVEEVEADSNDDDDKHQVLEAMQKIVNNEDEKKSTPQRKRKSVSNNPLYTGFNQKNVESQQLSEDDDNESEDDVSDSEDDYDSSRQSTADEEEEKEEEKEEEEEEEKDKKKREKKRRQAPPSVPTSSPPKTNKFYQAGTYLIPVKNKALLSADTDINNFFRSADETSKMKVQAPRYKLKQTVQESGLESTADSKIYESIQLTSTQNKSYLEVDSVARHISSSQDKDKPHNQLPKGQRDKIEYQAFQDDIKRHRNEKRTDTEKVTQKKQSRMCYIM